jgi:hypothetical protein
MMQSRRRGFSLSDRKIPHEGRGFRGLGSAQQENQNDEWNRNSDEPEENGHMISFPVLSLSAVIGGVFWIPRCRRVDRRPR